MNSNIPPAKKWRTILSFAFILFTASQCFSQKVNDWQLDRMPVHLEADYALSALPAQLRQGAAVYLLDPKKGYYLARKGTNGFITFVARTEWEWSEFRSDIAGPMSYDAEGAKVIFPVYQDVAAMRASGKYTALQIRNIVIDRIKKGIYKAPTAGISYMLAPVLRWYVGTPDKYSVITMNMPHYMPYAPYLSNKDIGNIPDGQAGFPYLGNAGESLLGAKNSPYAYMILPMGEKETAKRVNEYKDLLKQLADYKSYFRVE